MVSLGSLHLPLAMVLFCIYNSFSTLPAIVTASNTAAPLLAANDSAAQFKNVNVQFCHDNTCSQQLTFPILWGEVGNFCDTMDLWTGSFGTGQYVTKFGIWGNDLDTSDNDGHIIMTMYEGKYCTGPPVGAEDPSFRGQYWANLQYKDWDKGWIPLGKPANILSYRVTWVPKGSFPNYAGVKHPSDFDPNKPTVGVKLVLWPALDMDKSINTWSEITCAPDDYRNMSFPEGMYNNLNCASPVDRIYCMNYNDTGKIDNMMPMDFADNTEIPAKNGFWSIEESGPRAHYPAESGMVATYADSWNPGVCSVDPTQNQIVKDGWAIVAKVSDHGCGDFMKKDENGGEIVDMDKWCDADMFGLILTSSRSAYLSPTSGQCVNTQSGGDTCATNPYVEETKRPQKSPFVASCVWTRVVPQRSMGCETPSPGQGNDGLSTTVIIIIVCASVGGVLLLGGLLWTLLRWRKRRMERKLDNEMLNCSEGSTPVSDENYGGNGASECAFQADAQKNSEYISPRPFLANDYGEAFIEKQQSN